MIAVLAAFVAASAVTLPRTTTAPPSAVPPHEAPTVTPVPASAADTLTTMSTRLAATTAEFIEVRRVLDDAQSALAQRDREIATAHDELRTLRQELDALRAKSTTPAP